ncbi:glycosyl hydrolase family protein [Labilibacter sediminis]|nr:glycosyl hydrolase family protein [Labilibacter sediminis]
MNKMKIVLVVGFVFAFFLFKSGLVYAQFIDETTPENAQPTLISATGDNWELDFTDEFEGTVVNSSKWNINVSSKSRAPRPDLGISDWWWKAENVWQENGELVLKVSKYDSNTMHCGSVNSNNLYETQYGYFETRIKIADASKGTHTAFWFQGDNMGNVDGTANDGAEIDVFESAWLDDYTKSVVHIDGYGVDHQANTKRYDTPGIHVGYHVWGLHWTEDFMNIYYDGELMVSYSDPKWVVQSPEFIWLSDGASFGYSGDNFTRESVGTLTHAYVDYVRVWKNNVATSSSEYECESLSSSSPTAHDIQVKTNTLASAGEHVKFVADNINSEIVFQVPIDNPGNHTLTIQGLTWANFGQYSCAVETSTGVWQELNNTIDFYNNASTVVTQSFEEINLPAGTYNVKFKCIGKNSSSTNYVGSFDKLIVSTQQDVSTGEEILVPESDLSIYPNPVNDVLYISGLKKETTVTIYNASGHQLLHTVTANQVNVSQLLKGLYLIKINNKVLKFSKW